MELCLTRKNIKLILFITGAVLSAGLIVRFLFNLSEYGFGTTVFFSWVVVEMSAVVFGLTPMSISMLMHAKDIKHEKRGLYIFLKAAAAILIAICLLDAVLIGIMFGKRGYHSPYPLF